MSLLTSEIYLLTCTTRPIVATYVFTTATQAKLVFFVNLLRALITMIQNSFTSNLLCKHSIYTDDTLFCYGICSSRPVQSYIFRKISDSVDIPPSAEKRQSYICSSLIAVSICKCIQNFVRRVWELLHRHRSCLSFLCFFQLLLSKQVRVGT